MYVFGVGDDANLPLLKQIGAASGVFEWVRSTEPVDDDILTSSGIIHLKNKTTDELLAMQKYPQDQLKRYEQALRTAMPVLNERKQ